MTGVETGKKGGWRGRVPLALVAGLLVVCTAWGRNLSIDLRPPTVQGSQPRLLSVPAHADRAEGTLRRVDISAGATSVGSVDIGDELEFTLFDDVKITLRLTDRSPSLLEGDVFLAEASGYDGVKNAVVLRTAEGLTVDVQDYLNDRVYKVISTPSGVTVQEIEPVKGGRCGRDAFVQSDEGSPFSGEGRKRDVSPALLADADGVTTYVDILVVYDGNATTWANSHGGGVTNFAQTTVAKMNTALGNTGLSDYFQFRLAGVTTVNVTAPDVDSALDAVQWQTPGWEGIANKRDEVGADIVSILIDNGEASGTTGVGYVLKDTKYLDSFSTPYNACLIRAVNQGHTMTHEVGHNMGADHATAVNPSQIDPGPGLYSYSSAFHFTGTDGEKYYTVMAYNWDGFGNFYASAPYFSSPDHSYKGTKVGDAMHDNTRTLLNTYSHVARWRTRNSGLSPGSCEDAAVPFTTSPTIATYNVALVKEWLSGSYSVSSGAFFARTPVAAGRLYTIAMPKDSDFTVTCADTSIAYGKDDNLLYCLIDARSMKASVAPAMLAVHGAVGEKVTVYAVAADYMPLGNNCKPEVLPASSANGQFRYDVTRNLRSGVYGFMLNAASDMLYEMRVSGRKGLEIDMDGTVQVLDSTKGDGYGRIFFSCPNGGPIRLNVSAHETGAFSVTWLGVPSSKKFTLFLDANGGTVPVAGTQVAYGDRVGALPVPAWMGHVFDGWHTAREGGTRVTADTKMTVAADITLYAHWTALAAGSCEGAAVGFAMTDSVKAYNVVLTREWLADGATYGNEGVLCCVATVERGRFYTIAMPLGSSFAVRCDDDGAVVTCGEDDALAYCLVDTRAMHGDSATVCLCISGDVGERATVYAVASDYMPIGSSGKPEVLPADNAGGAFSYKVSRTLRNGNYDFRLIPEPDMVYELRVSGQCAVEVSWESARDEDFQEISCSDGNDGQSASVSFSCPAGNPVFLHAAASASGPIVVEWSGYRDGSTLRLVLDGNGGTVPVGHVAVGRDRPVGDIPEAERAGFFFDGWFTQPAGGTRVTGDTAFNSASDVTIYARWKDLVRGSSRKAPVPFAVTADIRMYAVPLTAKWNDAEAAYSDDGVLFCTTTVRRGDVCTIAMPLGGPDFTVDCEAAGATVSYGCDDALRFALVDARRMNGDSGKVFLGISGGVGDRATVYAVAADYMPLGSAGKPEVLPATITNADGRFSYRVSRNLRNGSYDFTLNAVPSIVYGLRVSGRAGLDISFTGNAKDQVSILDSSNSHDSASVMFSSQSGGRVSIRVDADETGPVSVEWYGVVECDNCYDAQP